MVFLDVFWRIRLTKTGVASIHNPLLRKGFNGGRYRTRTCGLYDVNDPLELMVFLIQ